MKKIVIFSDWFVPGFKAGGPIQSVYRMATILSKKFKVYVITSAYDLGNFNGYDNIQMNVWKKINDNLNVKYLSKDKINLKEMRSLILEFNQSFFVINGVFSTYFSICPLILLRKNKNTFVFPRGMLHQSAMSVKPIKKIFFLKISKLFSLFKNIKFIASNNQEKVEILRYFENHTIHILPNIPIKPIENAILKEIKNEEMNILFLGRISPEKNPVFLVKALQITNIKINLILCGSAINLEYKKLLDLELKKLPENIKFKLINEMEHAQVMEILKLQDLMILPSLGENFGHAIYESLSLGVPVIIGNNTPWSFIHQQEAGYVINPKIELELKNAIENFHNLSVNEQNNYKLNALNVSKKYYFEHNFEDEYQKLFI